MKRWRMGAAVGALALSTGVLAQEGIVRYPGGRDLGQQEQMAAFTTPDSPDTVIDFYVRAWEDEGLPATVEGRPGELQVVAAFLTREGRQRLVVVQPSEEATLGFRAERDLPRRAPPARSEEPSLRLRPVEPEVEIVPGTLETVWRARWRVLQSEGFEPVSAQAPRLLRLRSRRELLTLALAPVGPGQVVVLEVREPIEGGAP